MSVSQESCAFDEHEWSDPIVFEYRREGESWSVDVEACVECCATRIIVPNGIDACEVLGLVRVKPRAHELGGDFASIDRTEDEQRERLDNMRRFGLAWGYPACCIEAFVADVAADRAPARLRGSRTYVPCNSCRQRFDGGDS